MTQLRAAVDGAAFVFVTGKGGTGKTTAAGALALEIADAGRAVHLISTDPAHSLSDLFRQATGSRIGTGACADGLTIEEFDAAAYAERWLARSLPEVSQIVQGGTYLDGSDVMAFSRLALPGLDEMMAVLRLADLAREPDLVIVDTAPTGHTLRLLDAAATHESVARALRAMADKAGVVAGSMARRSVRLSGERVIDELNDYVAAYRNRVLGRAAFVLTTREGEVVEAESARLAAALERRHLHVVATVVAGGAAPAAAGACFRVPWLQVASGCDGLRAWRAALYACPAPHEGSRASGEGSAGTAPRDGESAPPQMAAGTPASLGRAQEALQELPELLLFGGKGGVGKSTCAAAAAIALAGSRRVLLCSTDPAGSLDDVFGTDVAGAAAPLPALRVLQIDPEAELQKLGDAYRADVEEALEGLGLSSATLDRRVIEAVWDLAPPGLDEVAALIAMLETADTGETVILDSAPTGHFLRLLSMPQVALDWTRQLMRVVVKYGLSATAGGAAEKLLRLSRQLRALQERLHDGTRAAVVLVTLDEPLVTAETQRLGTILRENDVRVAAVVHNRAPSAGPPPDDLTADGMAIAAPLRQRVVGVDALREFVGAWKIVE